MNHLLLFHGGRPRYQRLEHARIAVMEALYGLGWRRVDPLTPARLMRAYFGERWASLKMIDLDDAMTEEAASFLERFAIEVRMVTPRRQGRLTRMIEGGGKVLPLAFAACVAVSFVGSHLMGVWGVGVL
jgi:hypothetical protein